MLLRPDYMIKTDQPARASSFHARRVCCRHILLARAGKFLSFRTGGAIGANNGNLRSSNAKTVGHRRESGKIDRSAEGIYRIRLVKPNQGATVRVPETGPALLAATAHVSITNFFAVRANDR